MQTHFTYMGVLVTRNTSAGYALRWTSITPRLAADTKEGMKRLIRETLKGSK